MIVVVSSGGVAVVFVKMSEAVVFFRESTLNDILSVYIRNHAVAGASDSRDRGSLAVSHIEAWAFT